MLRMAVLTCALAGCVYQPGSFKYGIGPEAVFAGRRATIGCLDIAVARRTDFESKAVLQYRFGNRCNRPLQVDLGQAAVVGRFADGGEVALSPYDPQLEIRPVYLDGRLGGGEALAYPTPRPLTQICVDAASIIAGSGGGAWPVFWMCFATRHDLDDGDGGELAQPAARTAEVAP